MIFEKIQKAIADQMRIKDLSTITLATDFRNDLKADSLDLAEMLMQMEDELKISIPSEKAIELKNVGDTVKLLEELTKKK